MSETETIAAISTSVGEAGIGVVRVSGPESIKIARTVFRNLRGGPILALTARKMTYGRLVDPETGDLIDEALVVYMPAPHSYTCEDVVEFQLHGGSSVLRRVLEILLQNGARLADPGEFTQRAFLNGRIDLVQAEAVMNIIRAKTDSALKNATGQLTGKLSGRISDLRSEILDLLARVEAAMDYPEEELESLDCDVSLQIIASISQRVDDLLSTAKTGIILREGLRTVIVGRPNVGKSSLMNALLGESRALVAELPGTTRDSIEEILNVRGIPLRIVDTAGLRHTEDQIEIMGIERTRAYLASAGLVLFLLDASEALTENDRDIFRELPEVPVIIVLNKVDLPILMYSKEWQALTEQFAVVTLSALKHTGFSELEQAIEKIVYSGEVHVSQALSVDNLRHVNSLKRAREQLQTAEESLRQGLSAECMVIDLRSALESLGQITGETVSDEVVREIFAKFCLGK